MLPGQGRGFSIRAAVFCATVFFAFGIYLPFFPLWLAGQGLTDTQIATALAAPLFIRIAVTPLLAAFAEKLPDLRLASALYGGLSGLLIASLLAVDGYWPILVLSAAAMVFWSALVPLSDAVILVGVREHGIDYARVRLWGSAGFVAASIAGAAVMGQFAGQSVLTLLAAAYLACGAVALVLPRVTKAGVVAEPYGLRRAFRDPTLRNALLAGNLITASHAAFYTFGSLYWKSQGFGEETIGALWAFAIVAEIGLFWAAKSLPGWGARGFLMIGAGGALIRWLLFPFATWPAAALMLQALHALTFALTHLGIIAAIAAVSVPGHTARLQAAYQVLSGFMLAVMTLVAGPLYQLSPLVVFLAMAALALPALLLASSMRRELHPQRATLGGSTIPPEE